MIGVQTYIYIYILLLYTFSFSGIWQQYRQKSDIRICVRWCWRPNFLGTNTYIYIYIYMSTCWVCGVYTYYIYTYTIMNTIIHLYNIYTRIFTCWVCGVYMYRSTYIHKVSEPTDWLVPLVVIPLSGELAWHQEPRFFVSSAGMEWWMVTTTLW